MTLGYMVALRTQFAACLRPFKGGTAGEVEIRRVVQTGTTRTWPASVPAEVVSAHWEPLDSQRADSLGIDLAGTIGRQFYFDGVLNESIPVGSKLIVDDVTWQVERASEPGNNSPIDSVMAVKRG